MAANARNMVDTNQSYLYRPPPGYFLDTTPSKAKKLPEKKPASTDNESTVLSEATIDDDERFRNPYIREEFELHGTCGSNVKGPNRITLDEYEMAKKCGDSSCRMEYLRNTLLCAKLKKLQMHQAVMDTLMRKLLGSLKEIKVREHLKGHSALAEKKRRDKLTRMVQILILQRRNLQEQTDDLEKGLRCLLIKYAGLNKQSVQLERENSLLKEELYQLKQCQSLGTVEPSVLDVQRFDGDGQNPANHQQAGRDIIAYKTRNVSLGRSDSNEDGRTKTTAAVPATGGGDTGVPVEPDCISWRAEVGALHEQLGHSTERFRRLQQLYVHEASLRRMLHDQLQQTSGSIRVICRCRPSAPSNTFTMVAQRPDSLFPQFTDVISEEGGDGKTDNCVLQFYGNDRIVLSGLLHPGFTAYTRQLVPEQPSALEPKDKCFIFDKVLRPTASQTEVFNEVRQLIASAVDGFNICLIAYGPTGSGKSYTMQGLMPNQPGLIPRAVTELFDLCAPLELLYDVKVTVSLLEVFNEVVYDLLADDLRIVKLADSGSTSDGGDVCLIDATELMASTDAQVTHWLAQGQHRRRSISTQLTATSSRSHIVTRLNLLLTSQIGGRDRRSTLIFCDLAASSSAEFADSKVRINTDHGNRSLVALGRVFDALRRRSLANGTANTGGMPNAPYRESKLTHLLKPCLSGKAKCALIVTASGEMKSLDKTLLALQFAQRCVNVALGTLNTPNQQILNVRTASKAEVRANRSPATQTTTHARGRMSHET